MIRWTRTQRDMGRDESMVGSIYTSADGRFVIEKHYGNHMTRVVGPGAAHFADHVEWRLKDDGRLVSSHDRMADAKRDAERLAR